MSQIVNGKIVVTERITFDVHAASKYNTFWELWRDLPESEIDGVTTKYNVLSVKQVLPDGTEKEYTESPKLYWYDSDYTATYKGLGPEKWYHSPGPYNESRRKYECVFFYIDGVYREQMTFEIQYEMTNAALKYNDCSELYLCFYSEDTIKYLNSFEADILIPNKDMPSSGNYTANTYGTNSNNFPFVESDSVNPGYHTFSMKLNSNDLKFKPYNEYLEFSLVSFGNDKHIFTEYCPNNYYTYDNVLTEIQDEQKEYEETPILYSRIKFIILLISSILAYHIADKTLKTDKKLKEKYNFYEPSLQMDYFRDIPSNLDPSFAADLAFCKDKKKKDKEDVYAAILLSLVRKRYLALEKINEQSSWVSSNVKIVILHHPSQEIETIEDFIGEYDGYESLTPTEEYYFNLIVRHATFANEISMNELQQKVYSDYANTDTFVNNIDRSTILIGISQGYFQKMDFDEPVKTLKAKAKTYKIFGFIILIIFNLISYQTRLNLAFNAFTILGISLLFSSRHLNKIAHKYLLLTQFGEDEYVKWNGLYRFLNSETLMNERTVIELPIWEQYLVYATAFGISEKVIKALELRCPDLDTSSPMLSNPYYRSRSFYVSNRSFRTSVRSASRSYRLSSYGGGYGGHGGYGGGGRGGGGGGGGH